MGDSGSAAPAVEVSGKKSGNFREDNQRDLRRTITMSRCGRDEGWSHRK